MSTLIDLIDKLSTSKSEGGKGKKVCSYGVPGVGWSDITIDSLAEADGLTALVLEGMVKKHQELTAKEGADD